MKVNPDKFQAIIFANKHESNKVEFGFAMKHIPCNSSARLQGFTDSVIMWHSF